MAEKNTKDLLQKLLAPNNDDVRKKIFMKRFGVDFEVRAIEPEEMTRITQRATRHTAKKEKIFDEDLFNYLTIASACVTPNWNDQDLIQALDAVDAVDAIKKRLLFGEVAALLGAIGELNGFDQSDEEQIEEAKN